MTRLALRLAAVLASATVAALILQGIVPPDLRTVVNPLVGLAIGFAGSAAGRPRTP